MFQMKVDNSKLQGAEVIPAGIYEFRFVEFKPKKNKTGDSVNLNATLEIINNPNPDLNGRKVFDSLSFKAPWSHAPFVNAFGMDLETDGTSSWIPGEFDADKAKFKEDDPTTWVYRGPLTNRSGKLEIKNGDYNGKPTSNVERYFVQDGFTPRPM